MYLTGFADEAAQGIDGQIKATKELGWECIESRNVDNVNIHNLPEDAFDVACEKLEDAGIKINCFGSAIANWGKNITDPFDSSLAEARRAIPRMRRLGVKLIRIMSFAVLREHGPEDQMEEERFRRVRELQKLFTDEGMTPVHENCMNYGGMGWKYTLRLIENVPGLKLVFDTGNPVFADDRSRKVPYPKQSAWEFYTHVKEHIEYIHIKDGIWNEAEGKTRFTFPGEGNGDVRRIIEDLLCCGYDGGISIEPHLSVVVHDDSVQSEEQVRYDNYIEYGRRMMKLIDEVKP